jgi:hypothetical protein
MIAEALQASRNSINNQPSTINLDQGEIRLKNQHGCVKL